MEELEPKPHKIEAYDQNMVNLYKEVSDRNNELAALCHQEEETRIKLINLKKSIHDLKKGDKIRITDILVPMGGFFRFLKPSEKNDFIKHHIDTYNSIENQYMGITGQRVHREDEFGECNMRLLKNLWSIIRYCYNFTDQELYEKITIVDKPGYIIRDEDSVDETIKKVLEVKE
jgi:hypothetical protein